MPRKIGADRRNIQNLSRAINKIDKDLENKTFGIQYAIKNVKTGINDITYTKDGVTKRVRYDEIQTLSNYEQASLLNTLNNDRYALRQKVALQSVKEKGQISKQFKKSIEKDNPKLFENIKEFEEQLQMDKEQVKETFSNVEVKTGMDWFDEADEFFQIGGSIEKYDFYRPGQSTGFSELNAFTWNTFKVIRGL